MRRREKCPTCNAPPYCGVVRSARAWLGAWARERRRQMGDGAYEMGRGVPDREAMAAALPAAIETCDCGCHKRDAP